MLAVSTSGCGPLSLGSNPKLLPMKIETKIEGRHYACYIPEHDIYFCSYVEKGMEMVEKRAKALVKCKTEFMMKYGWMFDRN